MSETVNIEVREARGADAAEVIRMMEQIGSETTFLVMDERGMRLSVEQMAMNLEGLHELDNNVMLVAEDTDAGKLVGFWSCKADDRERIAHVGEFSIAIQADYQGYKIGPLLMEEGIYWARESGVIRRLELTCQARNARAVKMYESFGFNHEAYMVRGAFADGEFLDVHLMAMMID
jgi:RimJ/RimL family protein N-acetyltransferase